MPRACEDTASHVLHRIVVQQALSCSPFQRMPVVTTPDEGARARRTRSMRTAAVDPARRDHGGSAGARLRQRTPTIRQTLRSRQFGSQHGRVSTDHDIRVLYILQTHWY